jgi:hypothetical protein
MMEPIIDHIQITVKDMSVALPSYDKFLPLLGFDIQNKVGAVIDKHEFHVVENYHPRLAFAITSPRSAFATDTIIDGNREPSIILCPGPLRAPKSTGYMRRSKKLALRS